MRVRQSVVEHLQHQHPGREVAIRRIEHLIPDVIDFRIDPVSLIDPESFRVMLDQPIEEGPIAAGGAPVIPEGQFPLAPSIGVLRPDDVSRPISPVPLLAPGQTVTPGRTGGGQPPAEGAAVDSNDAIETDSDEDSA